MKAQELQHDWLSCFVAVVDAGSLSGAAQEICRSQSAVSMQLKKLEAAVGCQLIERGPRHLQLTLDGQKLLGYARRILELHQEAQQAFTVAPLAGRVRLGVPDDYAPKYLTPALRRFASRYQGVEIELVCEQSTVLIPKIDAGELDLALISREHPRQGTLLFHEPMVWVGCAQFELWRRDPLPIAVHEEASLARRGVLHALALQGRRYKVVYQSSSLAGQLVAVESGLAVAVLTQCSAPAHLQILGQEQGLGPLEPMEVAVYRSQHSRDSQAVDSLQELLLNTLRVSSLA